MVCSKKISSTSASPRIVCDLVGEVEEPREWQKVFTVTSFRLIDVLLHIAGARNISRYTEVFVISTEVPPHSSYFQFAFVCLL